MKNKILMVEALSAVDWQQTLLERAGLQVFCARTFEEASAIQCREKPDVIIAEMGGAGSVADSLCRQVGSDEKRSGPALILLCSSPEEALRAQGYGAHALLEKPSSPEALLEKVGELLAVKSREGYRVLVSVEVRTATSSETFFSSSQNISVTGMLIETAKPMETGDSVTCSFSLPGGRRVKASGEVVRVATPAGPGTCYYGIRFAGIDDEARRNIESFVGESIIFS